MKTFKSLLLVGLSVLGLTSTTEAQLAQTPFNGSFLVGNNLAITGGATLTTNTYAGTNTFIKGGVSITNGYSYTPVPGSSVITNTAAFADVGLWYDRDGSQPAAAVGLVASGLTVSATNFVTFYFAGMEQGFPSTSVQNQWQFSITLNGTNTVALMTNLPAVTFQATHKLRLTQLSTTGGTNFNLNFIELKGFKP